MIADTRIIQKDKKGYFYIRYSQNGIRRERLIKSKCTTCHKEYYQHLWKPKKEKYCSHSCMPIWNKGKKYSQEEKAKLNFIGLQKGRAWNNRAGTRRLALSCSPS